MANKIQIRRGLKSTMPAKLAEGEFGYCLDVKELWIGNTTGANTRIGGGDSMFASNIKQGTNITITSAVNASGQTELTIKSDIPDATTTVKGKMTLGASRGAQPWIDAGTAIQYWRGDKTWQDFATAVRGSALTGFVTTSNTAVVATDTVLISIGKLQAQINNFHSRQRVYTGVANTNTCFAGVTTEASGAAANANGEVSRVRIMIPFGYPHAAVPTVTVGNNTAGWAIQMGDNTVINLSALTVESRTIYGAVLLGTMASVYPSNSPCLLRCRTADATITVG